ncbi:hypothetical protein [Thermocrinis sp.]|jgi:hypothetical protein|uniref:hypothetical protein n=1 Tax=Thermocrinis sp. TaxID=2024383 RepID=UPI00261FAE41|nr:hypothetical protein [Thermocrinis sp.]
MKRSEKYLRFGVKLEDRYLIYEEEHRRVAVPYAHIAFLYVSKNNLVIQTDSVERVVIKLDTENTANELFEDILVSIQRLYFR